MTQRPLIILLVALALGAVATHAAAAHHKSAKSTSACTAVPAAAGWGMIGPDRRYVPLDKRVGLYKQLGLGWVRVTTGLPVTNSAMTSVDDMSGFRAVGLKTFLTVTDRTLNRPAATPEDLDAFSSSLKSAIESYHPAMVVVENEADNPPHAEPAADYLRELKIACSVSHGEGVPCTDSGMTTKMMIVLVIKNYLSHGDVAHANQYAKFLRLWYPMHFQMDPTGPALISAIEADGAERAWQILTGLRAAGVDRVDMHWYVRPSGGFSPQQQQDILIQVMQMLHGVTGLPIAGGEVGMDKPHGDDINVDPAPFVAMMSTMANYGVAPLIVWNPGSGLFPDNQNGRSLVDARGDLLTIGRAYASLTHARAYSDGMGKSCK